MTATFDGLGFEFMYPEGWELQTDESAEWPRTVSVHSPTGAFVSLTLYERSDSPENLLDETLAALRTEYEEAEIHRTACSIPGMTDQDNYEADFYCLDLLVTARVGKYETDRYVLLAFYQGENRDFDKLISVFDAIVLNTLNNLTKDP
ncbi:MAG: hypothetical protein KDB27_05950 [Planctomycetales bacterium]|nr:hypothetical protein [Planctomycetales bacterium]